MTVELQIEATNQESCKSAMVWPVKSTMIFGKQNTCAGKNAAAEGVPCCSVYCASSKNRELLNCALSAGSVDRPTFRSCCQVQTMDRRRLVSRFCQYSALLVAQPVHLNPALLGRKCSCGAVCCRHESRAVLCLRVCLPTGAGPGRDLK